MSIGISTAAVTPTAWPESLPAPLSGSISVSPGGTISSSVTQAGTTRRMRFGSGAPDIVDFVLRLTSAQHETLKDFWDDDLENGTGWASADWLTTLGYSSSYCFRFIGYPKRKVQYDDYADWSARVLVMLTADLVSISTAGTLAARTGWLSGS